MNIIFIWIVNVNLLNKKTPHGIFFTHVEARYCIMCLFRMTAAEGGGGGWLHLKTRAEDANFLAGGSL